MPMQAWKTFLTAGLAVASLTGCAHRRVPLVKGAPQSLEVPEGQVLTLSARGTGVQIYECRSSPSNSNPTVFAWTLRAPEAQLRYAAGQSLGRHYAGPTWEANDGSKVVGEVVAHEDGADGTAIPLLLLRAKQTSGTGIFSNVRSIQRLHTVGGKAPPTGCDQTYAGIESRVAYTADYYFYSIPQ